MKRINIAALKNSVVDGSTNNLRVIAKSDRGIDYELNLGPAVQQHLLQAILSRIPATQAKPSDPTLFLHPVGVGSFQTAKDENGILFVLSPGSAVHIVLVKELAEKTQEMIAAFDQPGPTTH